MVSRQDDMALSPPSLVTSFQNDEEKQLRGLFNNDNLLDMDAFLFTAATDVSDASFSC